MTIATQRQTSTLTTEAEEPLLDRVLDQTAARLDTVASRYSEALSDATMGRLKRAMLMATGIDALRKAITPEIMRRIMSLMNSPLGFKTDKSKGNETYDEATVRDCLVSALLQGVYPVGNEFNIIARQTYITKEGYERKLRETDGLTDLVLSPGVPMAHNGQTCVRFAATWNYRGIKGQLIGGDGRPGRVFPIITNQYSSPDAIVGKATRKALKAIYTQIHGSEQTVDIDEPELPDEAPVARQVPAPTTNGSQHHEPDPFTSPAETDEAKSPVDVLTELNLLDFLDRSIELVGAATTTPAINAIVADTMQAAWWDSIDSRGKKRFAEAVSKRRDGCKGK